MALFCGLLLFNLTAYGQLTDTDLNKIQLIVKEEVEKANEISEKRMKEYVSQEIAKEIRPVNATITEMGRRLNNIFTLVLTSVAFIAVVILASHK